MSVFNRRDGLGLLAMGGFAFAARADAMAGGTASPAKAAPAIYSKEKEAELMRQFAHVHEGKGMLGVAYFDFGDAASPAAFLTYDIPPDGSEGTHVHRLNDDKLGSYDEYYYIVSGEGHMEIDGRTVPVKAGDHVHTPLDVHHGIENSSTDQNLKVLLTYIKR